MDYNLQRTDNTLNSNTKDSELLKMLDLLTYL